MSDASELADLLSQDPSRDAEKVCWSALARVVDEDPTFVFADGDENGMTVTCLVLTGPFAGAEVPAMVSCPLGSGTELNPLRGGNRVLLQFLDGNLDGCIVATATVPGGAENPIPKAVAGVAVTPEGLAKERVVAPGKGVGIRYYVQGAAFLVRLKGAQDGFAGELYIEADDAKDSPNGDTGTFIRLVRDPVSGKFAIKCATAQGAFVNLLDDQVTLASGNNENQIIVNDDGVTINAKKLVTQTDQTNLYGTVLVNWLLPSAPVTGNGGALYIAPAPLSPVPGPIPVLGQSQTFFIGA